MVGHVDYLEDAELPTLSLEAVRRIAMIFSRSSFSRSSELEMRTRAGLLEGAAVCDQVVNLGLYGERSNAGFFGR